MDRPFSLYDVLNVSPGAPLPLIEASYRALMKKHHPDQAGAAAGTRAAEINAAFSILRDRERRAAYDRHEQARQRALVDAQTQVLRRRRRLVGWSGWGASALLVCAATAFAADRYGGVLVRPAQPIAVADKGGQRPSSRLDASDLVSEVLAESRKMALAPRPVGGQPAPTAPVAPAETIHAAAVPAPAAAPRRHAETPRAAEPAEGDFLERYEHIY
jgi:curved DNA-binding protein CbpA